MNKIFKYFTLIILIGALISCKSIILLKPYYKLNLVDSIRFERINDRCGEWGGDIETITIYKEKIEGPILANYSIVEGNCEELALKGFDKNPRTWHSNKNKLDKENFYLLQECINQLTKISLENLTGDTFFFPRSMFINKIISSDSSINIDNFGHEWPAFDSLKTKILK